MTKDAALKLALEALEYHTAQTRPIYQTYEAITAIKEALAQTEQADHLPDAGKKVRTIEDCPELNMVNYDAVDVDQLNDWAIRADAEIDRLAPPLPEQPAPQREWVGLTDEEILADGVLGYHFGKNGGAGPVTATGKAIIEVVTDMLKEKNI